VNPSSRSAEAAVSSPAQAATTPRPAPDPVLEARVAQRLAEAERHIADGAAQQAVGIAEECWQQIEHSNRHDLKGLCQLMLGWGHQYLGDMTLALRSCLQSRDWFQACHQPSGVARALSLAGAALVKLGDAEEALAHIDEATQVVAAVDDPVVKARVWTNMGVVQEALRHFDKAVAASETALQFVGELHPSLKRRIEANLLLFRIQASTQQCQRAPSARSRAELLEHCERVRREADAATDPQVVASLHAVLGEALLALGDVPGARAALSSGLETARSVHHHAEECPMLVSLAAVESASGHRKRAEQLLVQAMTIAKDRGLPEAEATCHRRLSEHHQREGDFRQALLHFQAFHDVHFRWMEAKVATRSLVLDMKLEAKRAQLEAEIFRLKVQRLEEDKHQLEVRAELLHRNAHEDPLTGLANRRGFDHRMALLHRPGAEDRVLTLALADIDHFKQVNDRFSHSVGDKVLQAVAALMQKHCRPSDVVARFGGEEFVLALVDADVSNAEAACERLREAIASHDWASLHPQLSVTLSFGVAPLEPAGDLQLALQRADQALYRSKAMGRNRVCVSDG
jgi:diguanylate cyclase (GGDEF)-like protein